MAESAKSNAIRKNAARGKLIVVPTPLGNLGDMSERALEALRSCDAVLAEDTRVTGKLLAAFDIAARLERLDENALSAKLPAVISRVASGEVLAYCSDAGMPGVSDPGRRLVRALRDEGLSVEVLPGPTAAATAYVASGTMFSSFYFGGFFPRKVGERTRLCESLRGLDAALIFYESPERLVSALAALAESFPYRRACVCRELTKLYEEVVADELPLLANVFAERERAGQLRGEIVIVVDGPSAEEATLDEAGREEQARIRAKELLDGGMRVRQAATQIASEFHLSRNAAYDIALNALR